MKPTRASRQPSGASRLSSCLSEPLAGTSRVPSLRVRARLPSRLGGVRAEGRGRACSLDAREPT